MIVERVVPGKGRQRYFGSLAWGQPDRQRAEVTVAILADMLTVAYGRRGGEPT
jgi:hypothetical protein